MRRRVFAGWVALAVTACTPFPSGPSGGPSEPEVPSVTPAPLPTQFEPQGDTFDEQIVNIVDELISVAGESSALKLDISRRGITLTVLGPNDQPLAYRWVDGVINAVDSDLKYLQQRTFDPRTFPLDKVTHMFTVAQLRGAGDDPMLQISQYQDGDIWMTVSTRTESATVFFNRDTTAVKQLDTTGIADIREGIAEVTAGAGDVVSIGIHPDSGYWADVEGQDDVIEHRVRMGGFPVFTSRRTGNHDARGIDVEAIDFARIAELQAQYNEGEPCGITIGRQSPEEPARITYECGSTTIVTRLDGTTVTIR